MTRHDAFGRALATILTDGTRTVVDYNEWDEVVATQTFEKKIGTAPLVLTSSAVNRYTKNGRLRLRAEQIEGADARGIGHSWQNADSLTTRLDAGRGRDVRPQRRTPH